jgi:hypothetical protein
LRQQELATARTCDSKNNGYDKDNGNRRSLRDDKQKDKQRQ